jgi:polyhydroxybutyrate depolymerase
MHSSVRRGVFSLGFVAVYLLAAACDPGPVQYGESRPAPNTVDSSTIAVAESGDSAPNRRVGLTTDLEVSVAGERRVYDVYAAADHWDQSGLSPVVVLLHGHRSSRSDLEGGGSRVAPYGEWQAVAEANNLLLLVPQGAEGSNGHAGWNDCRSDVVGNPDSDDVSFIHAALEQMSETHRVDTDRVFAVGTSNGGHMAIRLAQELPEVFAGIGVIAAGMPTNSKCLSSQQPVSAVFMWGTDDPIAPFSGGAMAGDRGDILSADRSIQYWIDRNRTATTPSVTAFPDLDPGDDSTVERHFYEGHGGSSHVALYRVAGGGHTEPSIDHRYRRLFQRLLGQQNHDIEMAVEVWNFFRLI